MAFETSSASNFLTSGIAVQVPTVPDAGANVVYLTQYDPSAVVDGLPDDAGIGPFAFEFTVPPEEKIDFKGVATIAEIAIPGAEGSILQPNGAEPLRISWKGILEDVFDAYGNLQRRAVDDVQTLDSMRLSGQVWVFQYLDLQHTCMIKRFDSTPVSIRGNLDRFEYSIELVKFYPTLGYQTPQTAQALIQTTAITVGSVLGAIQDVFDTIDSIIAFGASAVADVTNIIMAPVTAFDGTVAIITDQLTDTMDQINTVVANTQNAITTPASDLQLLQQQIQYNIDTVAMIRTNLNNIASTPQGLMINLWDTDTYLTYLQNVPALQPPPPTTYTVQEGDRIEDIALAYYGDGEAWRPIAYANDLQDPTNLTVGQVLLIPS